MSDSLKLEPRIEEINTVKIMSTVKHQTRFPFKVYQEISTLMNRYTRYIDSLTACENVG